MRCISPVINLSKPARFSGTLLERVKSGTKTQAPVVASVCDIDSCPIQTFVMTRTILQMIARLPTLRIGDIVSLCKGTTYGSIIKKRTETRKETSPSLDSAIKAAANRGIKVKIPHIPNVNVFNIKLNSYNPALFSSGLQTRLGSEKLMFDYRNKRANRYLKYMTLRLITLRETKGAEQF
jgi:hypothetical protein